VLRNIALTVWHVMAACMLKWIHFVCSSPCRRWVSHSQFS